MSRVESILSDLLSACGVLEDENESLRRQVAAFRQADLDRRYPPKTPEQIEATRIAAGG